MKTLRTSALIASICALLALPAVVHAIGNGTARLANVTPLSGGCVMGPTGQYVQAWDVEPGQAYAVTLSNVTECANGGTAPTLNVRVNGTTGNMDFVAVYVSPGVYTFDCTLPGNAACTYPILYCTVPGKASTGLFAIRNDGGSFQAHLRPSSFDEGCASPMPILGPDCTMVGTEESTWSAIKEIFR